MSIWDLIPTCEDPMSIYTLCALTLIVSAGFLAFTVLYRWSSNENRRIERGESDDIKRVESCMKKLEIAIGGHDDYIDNANGVINQIHIDLAVQESSMIDLKTDIAEIKADIKTLLKR
jgi:hypothetical protein